MSFSRILQIVTGSGIIVALFIGTFGNVMILMITRRNAELQNKSGMLLAITAIAHEICLLSEIFHAWTLLTNEPIRRLLCVTLIFPHLNSIQFQCFMSLIMVTDLLFAIIFPLWYIRMPKGKYVLMMCTPATIYALSFQYPTIITLKDDMIAQCNTLLVVASPSVAGARYTSNAILNTITVFVYIITLISFKLRCKTKTSHNNQVRQIMKRVSVTAIIFICSWYITSFGLTILHWFHLFNDMEPGSVLMLFSVSCYSQNFYICIWRSKAYRDASYAMFRRERTKSLVGPVTSRPSMIVRISRDNSD